MKTKLILAFLLFYSILGSAQYINKYNDTNAALKKQDDRAKEQAADYARKPNSPYVPTSSNSYNATPRPRISAEEIEKTRKYLDELEKKRYAETLASIAKGEAKREVVRPFREQLEKYGFTTAEAERMSLDYLEVIESGSQGNDLTKNILIASENLEFFKQNYTTASFDNLKLCIENLIQAKATITANDLVDILETRFPNENTEIYKLRSAMFLCYFKTYFPNQPKYEGLSKKMIDSYLFEEAKNSTIYNDVYKSFYNSSSGPYEEIDEYFTKKIEWLEYNKDKTANKLKAEKASFLIRKLKLMAELDKNDVNFYKILLSQMDNYKSLTLILDYDFFGFSKKNKDDKFQRIYGIYTLQNGEIYLGKFNDYRFAGKAYYKLVDGSIYFGEFSDAQRTGQGIVTKTNGYYKEGQFKKNEDYKVKYYNNLKTEISKEEFENSK